VRDGLGDINISTPASRHIKRSDIRKVIGNTSSKEKWHSHNSLSISPGEGTLPGVLDVGFKLVVASSANLLGEDIGSQPEEATSLWCIDSLGKSSGQSSGVVFSVESNVDFLRKLKVNLSSDLLWSFVVFGIIALDFSFELNKNKKVCEYNW
jgi:hypothetical protein